MGLGKDKMILIIKRIIRKVKMLRILINNNNKYYKINIFWIIYWKKYYLFLLHLLIVIIKVSVYKHSSYSNKNNSPTYFTITFHSHNSNIYFNNNNPYNNLHNYLFIIKTIINPYYHYYHNFTINW